MMTLENQPSMPTADTKPRCPTTGELQRYLAGWLEEKRSIEFESHLSECSACEPRVLELEAASNPLLAGLRDRVAPPGLTAESRVDLGSGEAESVAGDNHPADSDSDADADAEWIAAVSDEIGQREDGSSEATRASWRPPAEGFGAYELLRPLARTVGATHHFSAHGWCHPPLLRAHDWCHPPHSVPPDDTPAPGRLSFHDQLAVHHRPMAGNVHRNG